MISDGYKWIQIQMYISIFSGTFQMMYGDEAHFSQSSVCRVVKNVSVALTSRRGQFVKFPYSKGRNHCNSTTVL